MTVKTPIAVAYEDGIAPEIMEAYLHILSVADATIDVETIEIGEKIYQRGHASGIAPESCETLRRTQIFYKAPIMPPGRRL